MQKIAKVEEIYKQKNKIQLEWEHSHGKKISGIFKYYLLFCIVII